MAFDLQRSPKRRDPVSHVGEALATHLAVTGHAPTLIGHLELQLLALQPQRDAYPFAECVFLRVDDRLERDKVECGLTFATKALADDLGRDVQVDCHRKPLSVGPQRCRQALVRKDTWIDAVAEVLQCKYSVLGLARQD